MKIRVLLLLVMMATGYPIFKLQLADHKHYEHLLSDLIELQKLDAQANELMMRSRLGIDRNYDRLSALPAKIGGIQTEVLEKQPHLNKTSNRSIMTSYNSYLEAAQNKDSVIDNFKAHNSILRNSVKYAPIAADRLIQVTESNQLSGEAQTLKNLKADILEYSLTGRKTVKNNILENISKIQDLDKKLPQKYFVSR